MIGIKEANEAFKSGDYETALSLYRQIEKKSPNFKSLINYNVLLCKARIEKVREEKNNKKRIESICDFRFERLNSNFAEGWAVKRNDDSAVFLKVMLGDKNYSLVETKTRRDDVKKHFGGNGFSGFKAEINEYMTYDTSSVLSVTPISANAEKLDIEKAKKKFPMLFNGKHFKSIEETANKAVGFYKNKVSDNANLRNGFNKKVSIVILNLNGEKVIERCVDSVLDNNKDAEIIVVDHGSVDKSVELLKRRGSSRIRVVERGRNYSYSASNNYGAELASGDIVVFMNNDIILESDAITAMAEIVNSGMYGLLGIKLWDYPEGDGFQLDKNLKVSQHLGVQFRGLARKETIEAFELREASFIDLNNGVLDTPAVTAAILAIKKEDFRLLGGFDESYFYGQEDVDLCLRFSKLIDKKIGVLLDHGAYHIRGLSRKTLSENNKNYISNNRKIIQEKEGQWFRKEFRKGQFEAPGYWNQKPRSFAMIVSEVSFSTDKADFYTAKELGDALEVDERTVVGYFDSSSNYDVNGYDVVIVFIDGFDPRRLKNISPHAVIIGWARNWFDRWCERVWIEYYDMLYASSEKAQSYMQKKLKRKVGLLRIAASNDCLKPRNPVKKYSSDYVFTGSYFNSPREVEEALTPSDLPYKFKLFGYNWEKSYKFNKFTDGPVSYEQIPDVYASSKLVIDDANIATKDWGALNCRLYDSLALGVLCITNNSIGVSEIFDKDFDTYTKYNLNKKIEELLCDSESLNNKAKKYRDEVLSKHTYQHRAAQIFEDVKFHLSKDRIGIKIAAPDFERGVTWGDYHFAVSVRDELEKIGYSVRIDCMDSWYANRSLNDDVNLVLRGLDRFKPRNDQFNILWLISHPELISEKELNDYHKIFVASQLFAKKLTEFTGLKNISTLLQASSFKVEDLNPDVLKNTPSHDILFIGNSRNEYREVVKWCVEENLPLAIYGSGWEQFVPKKYIKGSFVSNQLIPYYYNKAGLVLNDHWADMKDKGFISNRVYDVIKSGGVVLTDNVAGVDFLQNKTSRVLTYTNKDEFIKSIECSKKTNMVPLEPSSLCSFDFYDRVKNIHETLLSHALHNLKFK